MSDDSCLIKKKHKYRYHYSTATDFILFFHIHST
jgi:hypothetical protein